MNRIPRLLLVVVTSLLLALARGNAVVINEIMYHSAAVPENNAQEWIELYNESTTATVDLTGWQFVKGVDFVFHCMEVAR